MGIVKKAESNDKKVTKKPASKPGSKKTVTKKANGTKKTMERRDVEKHFWFDLTIDETRTLAKKAGNTNEEIERMEEKFSDYKKAEGVKIKEKKTQLKYFLEILKTGKENRKTKCEEVKDFSKGEIRWVQGKETIKTVKMTDQDKQRSLDLNKKG